MMRFLIADVGVNKADINFQLLLFLEGKKMANPFKSWHPCRAKKPIALMALRLDYYCCCCWCCCCCSCCCCWCWCCSCSFFRKKTKTERKALVGHFVTTTTLHPKLVPESRDLLTSAWTRSFLRLPRPGGEPGIFWFCLFFSLNSSAFDHSATTPRH